MARSSRIRRVRVAPPMPSHEETTKELDAMATMQTALNQLDHVTRDRVLRYLCDRARADREKFYDAIHPVAP